AANVIAYNDSVGVRVLGNGDGNSILGNSVYGNHYLGIDLGASGVTPNDGVKVASQPNDGMDMPLLSGAVLTGASLSVSGSLAAGSSAFTGSRIEVFEDDGDASGFGEGRVFLGATTIASNGWFALTLPSSGVAVGDRITATATDAAGNTSEFGAYVTVTATATSDLTLTL